MDSNARRKAASADGGRLRPEASGTGVERFDRLGALQPRSAARKNSGALPMPDSRLEVTRDLLCAEARRECAGRLFFVEYDP